MVLRWSVMKDEDILCELMWIHILMRLVTVKLQFWTATDITTNPPRKQLRGLSLSLYSTIEHDTSAVEGRIALVLVSMIQVQ